MKTVLNNRPTGIQPLTFAVGATAFFVLLAFGTYSLPKPILPSPRFSFWDYIPLQLWMQIALLVGIVLPVSCLLFLTTTNAVRKPMVTYIGLLLIQIVTEVVAHRFLNLGEMSALIGIAYTSYRLCQLRGLLQVVKENTLPRLSYSLTRLTIWSGLIFWGINLLFLSTALVSKLMTLVQ